MKVALLGSNGFIGRRFCEILEEHGNIVRLIPRDWYSNYYALKKYLEEENPDVIINCAAYGNHSRQLDLHAMYEANVMNTIHLLEATKNIPYKAMLLMGSSSEYGIQDWPMSEYDITKTTSFYGASKVAQTILARAYTIQNHKPIAVIRPFSVYGPGEADFRFIPTVIRSILTGEKFKLAPTPTHDWIYIDDFIEGCLSVINLPITVDYNNIVNLGTEVATSNQAVVDLLETIGQNKSNYDLITQNIRSSDSPLWQADTHLAKRVFGWSPQTSLKEGLRKTFDYYREQYA